MNVSYNNLFLIKRLYLIRRARLVCTLSLYRTDRWYFANNKAARTLCKSIYPKSQLVLWPWSKRCQNTLLTLALVLEKILIMSIILSLNFADNRDLFSWPTSSLCGFTFHCLPSALKELMLVFKDSHPVSVLHSAPPASVFISLSSGPNSSVHLFIGLIMPCFCLCSAPVAKMPCWYKHQSRTVLSL